MLLLFASFLSNCYFFFNILNQDFLYEGMRWMRFAKKFLAAIGKVFFLLVLFWGFYLVVNGYIYYNNIKHFHVFALSRPHTESDWDVGDTPSERVVREFLSLVEQSRWEEAFQKYATDELYYQAMALLWENDEALMREKHFRNLRIYSPGGVERRLQNVQSSSGQDDEIYVTYTLDLRLVGGRVRRDVALRYAVINVGGEYRIQSITDLDYAEVEPLRGEIALTDLALIALSFEEFFATNGRYPRRDEVFDKTALVLSISGNTVRIEHDPWGQPYRYDPPSGDRCGIVYSTKEDVQGKPLYYKMCPYKKKLSTTMII